MATETVAEEIEAGMPQLDFSTFPNQIFWLVVTLLVIYLVLSRLALPRISAVLAERSGSITNDIAAAEDLKQKAKDAEAAYDKALADARAEAQKIADATRAEIRKELDAATAEADAEIAARTAESEKAIADIRASALDSIRSVSTEITGEVVAAVGGKADAPAIDAEISARLKG
ncbi:MAG: F0F1 ATP synthase subunit B' [Pseudomonadota bacterium]